MKIAGIVAEYNPFHNGHAYQIQRTRRENGGCEATHIVAVMSGEFTQRGEPALLSKFDRAAMALENGVDLVIELPLPWALASAESFALGAVGILDALGCVEVMSFGCEDGDLDGLKQLASLMETPPYTALLKYRLSEGLPFAQAVSKAVAEAGGASAARLLEDPNSVLAVEYLKALRRLSSPIVPFAVKRFGASHDQAAPVGTIASASYLRSVIAGGRLVNAYPYLPASCADRLAQAIQNGCAPARTALLERAVLAKLRTLSPSQLSSLPGISEGLENRLFGAIRFAGSIGELLDALKTRRYALTRLQRLLWAAFLDIPAGIEKTVPPYIRVLGANERGLQILSAAKSPKKPLLVRASQMDRLSDEAKALLALEARADDLYALALPKPLPCGRTYTAGFIKA